MKSNPEIGSRIRQLREKENLSLRALAERCGLSFNAISRIERGENSPTVATLHRLATALNVPLVDFFREAPPARQTVFTREAESFRTEWEGGMIESLGTGLPQQQLEVFRVTVEPESSTLSAPITHIGEEFVLCLEGEIEYRVSETTFTLGRGDSLLFKASQPHGWQNRSAETAVILIVFERAQQSPPLWQQHAGP